MRLVRLLAGVLLLGCWGSAGPAPSAAAAAPADGSGPTIPGETQGTLTVTSTYGGPVPDQTAGLCGEAVSQSGVGILVVDGANAPVQ